MTGLTAACARVDAGEAARVERSGEAGGRRPSTALGASGLVRAMAGAACLLACRPEPVPCPDGPATCVCARAADCGAAGRWACVAHACQPLCRGNEDCAPGEVCEELLCRPRGCASDAECGGGDQCLGGECRPPVDAGAVAGCSVQPVRALSRQGAARAFTIHARAADGTGLAYKGAATWTTSAPARGAISGSGVRAQLAGGAQAGPLVVGATLPGGLACEGAHVENFADVPPGKLRVVAADLQSSQLLSGARVVLDRAAGRGEKTTDARGEALFDAGPDEPRTVSVFHPLHAYVTYVAVRSRDLLVFARPFPSRAGFTGEMGVGDFTGLSELNERVHLALFGASLPGNILDLQSATLFGDLVPTELDLGAVSATAPLPSGVLIGLDEEMFRGRYSIFAAPGLRALWGLGGNASFGQLFDALAPLVTGEGKVRTSALVRVLLPLLNRFQSGVLTGQRVPETADLAPTSVPLTALLRLRLEVEVPALPSARIGGADVRLEGAAVVGGALLEGQGLVPLGLTAGADADEDGARDGLVNSPEPGGAAGRLPLNVAPLHGGLESGQYALVAAATSFDSIGLGAGDGGPLVVSGLVAVPQAMAWSEGRLPLSFGRAFLPLPQDAAVTGRRFRFGPALAGCAFHRLDLSSDWSGEWYLYFPPGLESFDVPAVPPGWDDRLLVPATAEPVEALLQSASLSDRGGALSFEDVVTFGGDDLDGLTGRLDAFSTREIPVAP